MHEKLAPGAVAEGVHFFVLFIGPLFEDGL
jgi:hypothetical protein